MPKARSICTVVLSLLVSGCDGCDQGDRSSAPHDPAEAASEVLAEGRALASAVGDGAGPGSRCVRASREIAALQKHLDPAAPPPDEGFVRSCAGLPAPVQDCLRPSYAAEWSDVCVQRVSALPEPKRALARRLGRLK